MQPVGEIKNAPCLHLVGNKLFRLPPPPPPSNPQRPLPVYANAPFNISCEMNASRGLGWSHRMRVSKVAHKEGARCEECAGIASCLPCDKLMQSLCVCTSAAKWQSLSAEQKVEHQIGSYLIHLDIVHFRGLLT